MFDVDAHTIFVTLAGSQAHGTARAGSDLDLRGVCVMPLEARVSLYSHFEQSEAPLGGALWQSVRARVEQNPSAAAGLGVKTESVIFDVAKFLRLCAEANPNALEILFADERDWVFETPVWRALHAERRRFLTRKVQQTYVGYALSQLKRIRTHRSWLLSPPEGKPSRSEFGLPDAPTLNRDDQARLERSIEEKLQSYAIDDIEMPRAARLALEERIDRLLRDSWTCSEEELSSRLRAVATHALHMPAEVAGALNAEQRYLAAVKRWESYRTWQNERNRERAALESRHGYDTKHAMHLVRLLRMGLEVIQGEELQVRRDDAAELRAIRDGSLSYDELMALANDLQSRMRTASEQSRLPADVDYAAVERIAYDVIRSANI